MTLPSYPNTISLAQIRDEFGNTGQVHLSNYYAGGGIVPAGSIGFPNNVAKPIPTSGNIKISNFYGLTSGAIVTGAFAGDFIGSASISPSPAISTYSFNTNGTTSYSVLDINDSTAVSSLTWYSPTTVNIGSFFYIRASIVSSTPVYSLTGAVNTWLNLNIARTWTLTNAAGPNVQQVVLLFELSTDSGGSNVVSSGNVTLDAETS